MTGCGLIHLHVRCAAGDLGVGSAQVVRTDRRSGPVAGKRRGQQAVCDRRDPVQRRMIVRDQRSRALENLPEMLPPRRRSPARVGPSGADQLGQPPRERARGGSEQAPPRTPRPRRSASRRRTPRRGGRRAPRTTTSTPGRQRLDVAGAARPARATAASRRRPAGSLRARASACALAIPIRSPVNVPGPTPTAIRSTPSQLIPAALEHARRSAPAGAWRAAAALPARRVVARRA